MGFVPGKLKVAQMRESPLIWVGMCSLFLASCGAISLDEIAARESVSEVYIGSFFANHEYDVQVYSDCVSLNERELDLMYSLFDEYQYVEGHRNDLLDTTFYLDFTLNDGRKKSVRFFKKDTSDVAYISISQGPKSEIIELPDNAGAFSDFAEQLENKLKSRDDCIASE